MSAKHFFVSDLHLFSRRSQGERYVDEIRSAAARAETLVLGGDIFDFTWTDHATIAESVEHAVVWLRQFAAAAPHCGVYYVLGNHDSHQLFIDRLDKLALSVKNFAWHPYCIRLANSVFLHGDMANRKPLDQSYYWRRATPLDGNCKDLETLLEWPDWFKTGNPVRRAVTPSRRVGITRRIARLFPPACSVR